MTLAYYTLMHVGKCILYLLNKHSSCGKKTIVKQLVIKCMGFPCLLIIATTPLGIQTGDGTSRPWAFYHPLAAYVGHYHESKQIPKVARVASSCFPRYRRKWAFRGWNMHCFGAFWGISQDWWRSNSYHFQDLFARLIGISGNCYNWELNNRSGATCTITPLYPVLPTGLPSRFSVVIRLACVHHRGNHKSP